MDDELRQNAMKALKRHKSGWIGLGKALIEIQASNKWKDWGYEKFWDYAKEELGLTTIAATEMMMAYEYIKNNEPSALNMIESKGDNAYIPDYHTLANLSKASNKDKIDGDKEDKIRDILFNADDQSIAKAQKEANDLLFEDKNGSEILNDINKKTNSIKKRVKKLNNEIHETSSFDNDILDTSDKLNDMIQCVKI